jgi:hypothetical protein
MKKMTTAMYRFTRGTSGCGCATRLLIESDRGLPGYSLLQVTFTRSHHSSLNHLSHVFCQPSRTRCLRMLSPRPERVDQMRTMIRGRDDGDGIGGLVDVEEAKAALTKVKDEYAMYCNRCWEPAPVFTQGDRVWLDGSDIATNRPSSKLSHRRLGPFVVDKCVSQGPFHLILPPQLRHLHPVFPIVKLSLAHPDPLLGR